ncbi:hypothetical protein AALA44_03155 [Enterococcus ratti]|uniref:hypothetical protein n=1 Tax=Enterococcus ratti TaxID=150033 RepID=UPI0035197570
MRKRNVLTIAVILGSMGSIISSGVVFADVKPAPIGIEKQSSMTTTNQAKKLEQIKLSDAQLKANDSDIDTWMPNKAVQKWVLRNLIWDGVLPADSSVNDITKDLLASDESDITWIISVDSFLGDDLTPNLTEGLQYVNDQIKIDLIMRDTTEDQFLKMDWKQLHMNVDLWNATVVSPDKFQNPQLLQKIKDAKLPEKTGLHVIDYQQGEDIITDPYFTPKFTKTINLKDQEFFPNINVSDSDLWDALKDKDLLATSLGSDVSRKGHLIAYDLYRFTKNSDGSYLGTPEDNITNRILMRNIKLNPENFYLTLVNNGIYYDGEHQEIQINGFTYANFTN